MLRLNVKLLLFLVFGLVFVATWSLWNRCLDGLHAPGWDNNFKHNGDGPLQDVFSGNSPVAERQTSELQGYEEIDCLINGDVALKCRKEGDEVYLPFSFIHKYFEVYGKLATYDGYERFEWSHSYSKVFYPKAKYEPWGVFMYFENYNVEVRERVKCLSATEGVPVSTQWESGGYYYPTQIAQFGLSHYSKNLTEPEPRRKVLEDGDRDLAHWQASGSSTFTRTHDPEVNSVVIQFQTSVGGSISLKLDHVLDFVLMMDIKFLSMNSSVTVALQNRESRQLWRLHYVCSLQLIYTQDQDIFHGMACDDSAPWHTLIRDLVVDLQKGLLIQNRGKRKLPRSKLKVVGIALRGWGKVDNVSLSTSEHLAHFYDAAQWFVKHQDPNTGGWANPVKRRVAAGMQDLEPGWYSAMGQGHAISVLARAYHHSGGDPQYLQAAINGLRPFRVPSDEGGVLASFLKKFPWYEEYPTKPASFVLNGFIYSLLGLYDLKTIAPPAQSKEASVLFEQGMVSLKNLLLLFDTGAGTSYDLRHFTLGTAPNLARWDYHATHVNQLLLLATIDKDPLIEVTARRWIGYMNGKRAAHN
ncbi:D-glucuronyl C5-epimerase B [Thrips palmi]|uniref:heparosan-N-sulfate-glucuronate 5-epimerase n=1 Tax=Thrips palmi TaxID=161013 RepID=A0A6P8ZRZ9_THRPL|nr:D-glucuronyl C5-epimerase B [Thrips palmi]